jgi:hypothetical protein
MSAGPYGIIAGMPIDAETLRDLYTRPPEEFVAARNALAKELRAAKDRDGATLVTKLRRPTVPEWALNVVAAEQPELIDSVLDAAARVRDAQAAAVEGREGGDVRAALRAVREHGQALLAAAEKAITRSGRQSAPQIAALTGHLAEITGNEAVGEQLRGAHLGSADVDAVDPFAGLAPAPRRTAQAKPAAAAKRQRTPVPKPEPAAPAADRAADRARERAVAAAERARTKAVAALAAATRDVEAAQRRLAKAEEAREQAEQAVHDADAAVTTAQGR